MNDMKVKDVMTNLVVMLYPRDTIREASQRLARNRVSGAPVVVDGKVVGIVSESDLIHASMPPVQTAKGMSALEILALMGRGKLPVRDHEGSVEDIMSPRVITVRPQASIWAAAELMERHGVKRLPVTDENGCLLGIISRADLVRAMSRGDGAIRTDILAEVDILGPENFDDLEVTVTKGVATLKGRADRLSTKRILVDLTARIPGVTEVVDRMTFDRDDTKARLDYPTPVDRRIPNRDPLALGLVGRRGER